MWKYTDVALFKALSRYLYGEVVTSLSQGSWCSS
jgi:hypothetical protein